MLMPSVVCGAGIVVGGIMVDDYGAILTAGDGIDGLEDDGA